MKRAFGLVTIVLGIALLGAAFATIVRGPFQWGPFLGGLLWGAVCLHFGRKWLFNLIRLDVISVEPGRPELEEATRKAQATLERFWDYLGENRYECFVKFPLETDTSGGVEHIWAVVHSRVDDGVVVSLANEPVGEPKTTDGRTVVAVKDIEDWQVFVSPTEIRGGYSIGALAQVAKSRGFRFSRADQRRLSAFADIAGEI